MICNHGLTLCLAGYGYGLLSSYELLFTSYYLLHIRLHRSKLHSDWLLGSSLPSSFIAFLAFSALMAFMSFALLQKVLLLAGSCALNTLMVSMAFLSLAFMAFIALRSFKTFAACFLAGSSKVKLEGTCSSWSHVAMLMERSR